MFVVMAESEGGPANGSSNTIKLAVTKAGKDALERIAEAYGMKEYVAAGRIYEWFVAQDDIVQRAVLGLLKGLEKDAARLFMGRLAAAEVDPPDVGVTGSLGHDAPPADPLDRPPVKKSKPRRAPNHR
jgi:hypothetical protein